ncbi:MAG: multicomponent Na+:H+ antiporter subunit [Gaiellaceae bacterium]|jgi:multicomponent Na+:H+ antiporter subunit D|nr:multicomponent Na+:H+ antiporter subunit [Gaiellaceae bacterium]
MSSTTLVPLVVVVPLLAAAALAALGHFAPPRVDNLVAIAVSAAVTAMCIVLVFRSADHTITYWFGGWQPRHGIAIGISFSVEPLGAGIAALAGALATAALIVSWDYFSRRVTHYFFLLILVFLGAMVGFALSSDLFNMFVFFEVMSVTAFALTGYRIEQSSVLQGAINFAVVNTIGALMLLTGIALIYGRTGSLNLAQIGQVLARERPDGLVIVAFTLIVVGFLTKAGAVPFHFWLSDAYAVAPAPVCVLFAGVMSDLGLHGVARTYWEAFSGALGSKAETIRAVLVVLGVLTALLGGAMAFLQSSLKRMLAFVVIGHVGVFLVAIALLTARGLAGATLYVIADGLVKGAVFCGVAHLARRIGNVDELLAHGRARVIPGTGAMIAVAALALAALPPLALLSGSGALAPVLVIASALTGAAVLRATARLFFGLGPERDDLLVQAPAGEEREVAPQAGCASVVFWAPGLMLLVAGLALAFTPGLAGRAVEQAQRFVDRPAVARETLHGIRPVAAADQTFSLSAGSYAAAVAGAVGAVGLAWLGLYRRRIPAGLRSGADRLGGPALRRLKLVHDGVVGEYVTWLTVGAAVLGALFAVLIR